MEKTVFHNQTKPVDLEWLLPFLLSGGDTFQKVVLLTFLWERKSTKGFLILIQISCLFHYGEFILFINKYS